MRKRRLAVVEQTENAKQLRLGAVPLQIAATQVRGTHWHACRRCGRPVQDGGRCGWCRPEDRQRIGRAEAQNARGGADGER